ncbi:MAG: CoA-transferase [Haloarculaceae archaeon]|jgi:glutaconate CoA-transferase subunit A
MSVTDMASAVSEGVSDGQELYLAGFTHLIPFAAGHEMIRQGLEDLTLVRATPDAIYDQMIAAGCAEKVVFSYAGAGLRRTLEEGDIEFEEYTHFGMVSRLAAGAYDLPFLPVRTFAGSDLPAHNGKIRRVESPYDGEEINVVPPLNPDVTVVHAHRADEHGNAQVWGIVGEIIDAALAADTVILTTEELVDEAVIRSDPNRTAVPGSAVDYVVEEPYCAHPSYVHGLYDRDRRFYRGWDDVASTHEGVLEYLDEWVYGVDDRREYVEKLGVGRLLDLQPRTNYATPVDMGGYQ